MNCYRISKYNRIYREKGVYLREEWTDYSDIGKRFNGNLFSEKEYLEIEQNYIDCVVDLLNRVNVYQFDIIGMEQREATIWKNLCCIDIANLADLIRDILRNKCWCRIEGKNCYLHFGFDYYMYIGVSLPRDTVNKICSQHNLFCEVMISPYNLNKDFRYSLLLFRDRVKCFIQRKIKVVKK